MPAGSIGVPGSGIIHSLRGVRRKRRHGFLFPTPLPPSAHNGGGAFAFPCSCDCDGEICGSCTSGWLPGSWDLFVSGLYPSSGLYSGFCPYFNGNWTLRRYFGGCNFPACTWGIVDVIPGSVCAETSCTVIITLVYLNPAPNPYSPGWYLQFGFYGPLPGCNLGGTTAGAFYYLSTASFNCIGTNTLSFLAAFPSSGMGCGGWPASLTLYPA